jgi:hypothetical protein
MDIELVEGEVIYYREVDLGFTVDDVRFAMGAAAADPENDDIEHMLATIATHHAFVDVFMEELRDILRKRT